MAVSDKQYLRQLLKRLGNMGMGKARPSVPSRTLRKGLNVFLVDDNNVRIQIPHYWAIFVHDGRGPFVATRTVFLVWFRNPRDDPRLRGGVTPVRANQLRRLTKSQFKEGLEANRRAVAEGREPPMIVTHRVRKGTKPTRFFGNEPGEGMHGFDRQAGEEISRSFSQHVRRSMGKDFRRSMTATIRL